MGGKQRYRLHFWPCRQCLALLGALVAETALNLRFHHAMSSEPKLRTYASFAYQAGSWKRPRKVVAPARVLASSREKNGMRQEVDIRYVVTSLKGSARPRRSSSHSQPRRAGIDCAVTTSCPRSSWV